MTILVINVARFLGLYWYLLVLPVLLWPFVNWGIVSVLSPRPEVVIPRRLWYFATWGVILLVVMFAVVALFVPLIGDIQAVSPVHVATDRAEVVGVKTAEGNAVDDRRGLRAFAICSGSRGCTAAERSVPCCVAGVEAEADSRSCRALPLGLSLGDNGSSRCQREMERQQRPPLHPGGRSHSDFFRLFDAGEAQDVIGGLAGLAAAWKMNLCRSAWLAASAQGSWHGSAASRRWGCPTRVARKHDPISAIEFAHGIRALCSLRFQFSRRGLGPVAKLHAEPFRSIRRP